MQTAHIMLVEGKNPPQSWVAPLRQEWEVTLAHTGTQALQLATQHPPHLIIFNAASLRSNGQRNCRRLRQKYPHIPLIHIHAKGTAVPPDLADIFLEHPFTARKLLNRVRTLIPVHTADEPTLHHHFLTLYPSQRLVHVEGRGETHLTPKLARLLEEFLRHPNQILLRQQLMEQVWQTSYIGDTRTLDVHIRWIREIIEPDPKKPIYLITMRGMGYLLQLPPEPEPSLAENVSSP